MTQDQDLLRSAASDVPGEALPAIAELRTLIQRYEAQAVVRARAQGLTWDEIAVLLGTTRQAVHRKYRHASGGRTPMILTLKRDVRQVVRRSTETAAEWNDQEMRPKHLFVELVLAGPPAAAPIVSAVGDGDLKEKILGNRPIQRNVSRPKTSDEILRVLRDSIDVAKHARAKTISHGHVLAALLSSTSELTDRLRELGVDVAELHREVAALASGAEDG